MPVTRYLTVDGEILSEKRGSAKRDYLPDPLGSTVALLDSTQTKTDSYTYWPYGEDWKSSGTTNTPFRFVGTLGYYRDNGARTYVRARTYRPALARWMTVDPLWPTESAFSYVKNAAVSNSDPSGTQVIPCKSPAPDCTKEFNDFVIGFCFDCSRKGMPPSCADECSRLAQLYYAICHLKGKDKPFPYRPGPWKPKPGVGVIPPGPIIRIPGMPSPPRISPGDPRIRPIPDPDYVARKQRECIQQSDSGPGGIFNLAKCWECCRKAGVPGNQCDFAANYRGMRSPGDWGPIK